MKQYLVIFKCRDGGVRHKEWNSYALEEKNQRMVDGKKKLDDWFKKHQHLVVSHPVELATQSLWIESAGVTEMESLMGSFLVIQAKSLEQAATIFTDHPHFSCFPGDGIQITECRPSAGALSSL